MTQAGPRLPTGPRCLAGAFVLYVALVGALTWPLALHLDTHVPEIASRFHFDRTLVTWALAHESRALLTDPTSLPHANIYHPAPRALFYAETGFGALPYFVVPFLLTGSPVLAANLTWLLSAALTALALHWVLRRSTGSELAGFVAAWTFLTSHWVLSGWAAIVPNYAVVQYFAPIVLLAAAPRLSRAATAGLLVLVVLQCLSSIYIAPPVIVTLTLIAIARVARVESRRSGLRLLGVIGTAVALLGVAYLGHLLVRLDNPLLAAQTIWPARAGRASLGFGSLQRLFIPGQPAGIPVAGFLLMGAGASIFAWRRGWQRARHPSDRMWIHFGIWSVVGVLLALPPNTEGSGTILAWPQTLLSHFVPIYDVLRAPERLAIPALIGLSGLAGLGFAELLRLRGVAERGWPVRGAALLVVASAMLASVPPNPWRPDHHKLLLDGSYPIAKAPRGESELTAHLREPGGPLLELPATLNPGMHAAAMHRSIFHRRPLLNGYSSYWPAGFPERMKLADRLPDPAALVELEKTTGLSAVLVNEQWLAAEKRRRWRRIATGAEPSRFRLVARQGTQMLFSVAEAEPEPD